MELNEYQKKSWRTANKDLSNDEQLKCACLGLSGESGELCDIVKKIFYHGHCYTSEEKKKMFLEIGDVLWYCALAASALGYNLNDIAVGNIDKLLQRYKDEFTSEESINRED
jgi:NTP pyrophosphatase (non-canonical NTP hydrolase)